MKSKVKHSRKPTRPAAKPLKTSRKSLQRSAAKATTVSRRKATRQPTKTSIPAKIVKSSNGANKPAKYETSKTLNRAVTKPVVEPPIPADKDLSTKSARGVVKDRVFLMVPDPYWLHCHWELTLQSVQRAEAALGQEWYGAKPVIRLFDVTSQDTTSTAEAPIRDIPIHGNCNHWYIEISQPPRTYRADVGYITRRGHFHPLCRSNVVTPPKGGAGEHPEENWPTENDEKSSDRQQARTNHHEKSEGAAVSRDHHEEQQRWSSKDSSSMAIVPEKLKKFGFELSAELIVTGRTDPNANVRLQNEPVKIRPDGTFTMRYPLTDGRQIIPAVAASADGMEERTIVLAVERNTRHLDPMVSDLLDD